MITPYRKPVGGQPLQERKEEFNTVHRKVRARVEHTLAGMKTWKILRDYRRQASTLGITAAGIAHLYYISQGRLISTTRTAAPHQTELRNCL